MEVADKKDPIFNKLGACAVTLGSTPARNIARQNTTWKAQLDSSCAGVL